MDLQKILIERKLHATTQQNVLSTEPQITNQLDSTKLPVNNQKWPASAYHPVLGVGSSGENVMAAPICMGDKTLTSSNSSTNSSFELSGAAWKQSSELCKGIFSHKIQFSSDEDTDTTPDSVMELFDAEAFNNSKFTLSNLTHTTARLHKLASSDGNLDLKSKMKDTFESQLDGDHSIFSHPGEDEMGMKLLDGTLDSGGGNLRESYKRILGNYFSSSASPTSTPGRQAPVSSLVGEDTPSDQPVVMESPKLPESHSRSSIYAVKGPPSQSPMPGGAENGNFIGMERELDKGASALLLPRPGPAFSSNAKSQETSLKRIAKSKNRALRPSFK